VATLSATATTVKGLFDDGTMVNLICNSTFELLQDWLGGLTLLSKTLLMADGACIATHGRWIGNVTLGGQMACTGFEVFPSGGR